MLFEARGFLDTQECKLTSEVLAALVEVFLNDACSKKSSVYIE